MVHFGEAADLVLQAARDVVAKGWKPGWMMIDKSRPEAKAILAGKIFLDSTDISELTKVQSGQICLSVSANFMSYKQLFAGMRMEGALVKKYDLGFLSLKSESCCSTFGLCSAAIAMQSGQRWSPHSRRP